MLKELNAEGKNLNPALQQALCYGHVPLSHIGLFEGIGGFSLAARWMNWETIAWCEYDLDCQKVLKKNFPNAIPHGDITKTDFTIYRDRCDILTGGFPCQPFSSAGSKKGIKDERYLWGEMYRAIREVRPSFVVAENVFGLLNTNEGLVFEQVHTDLEAEGYEVQTFLLPACGKSAPHKRDRFWFVAYSESNGNLRKSGNVCSENGRQNSELLPEFKNPNTLHNWEENWIEVASKLCRMDDGLPARLDESRLKQLGNAIVPQVAYEVFKTLDCINRHCP